MKTEEEECQDVDDERETDVTQEFVSCVKILKEVKGGKATDFYCFRCLYRFIIVFS